MCELSSGNCCTMFLVKAWGAGKMAIDALKALRENLAHSQSRPRPARRVRFVCALACQSCAHALARDRGARAFAARKPPHSLATSCFRCPTSLRSGR